MHLQLLQSKVMSYRTPAEVSTGASDERPINGKWTPSRVYLGKTSDVQLVWGPPRDLS